MPISRESTWAVSGKALATIAVVSAITLVCRYLPVNATTTGFAFLVAVLLIATQWGIREAIITSVAGMLCFNFFFLPPVGTLTIADPENWIALGAFLVTAIVASELSARAKRQATAAIERQRELERLYALGRAILLDSGERSIALRLAHRVAESFELPAVTLYDVASAQEYKAGPEDLTVPAEILNAALSGDIGQRTDNLDARFALIRLGGKPAGVLALRGAVSDTGVDAISSLVAIGLERARAQEIENRVEAARQSEQLKSTLLDAIAHEFKTPLTSIKAATTTVLADDRLLDEQKELLSIVDEEADRLNSLVSDAIQMSRIEGGKFKLNRARTTLLEVVDSVLARMRSRLEDRRVERVVPADSPPVIVDRDLIQLALRQLIDNALKYSPAASPIEIGAEVQGSDVRFWVADEGPGVARPDLDRVFERFYRASSSRHAVPGSGIGLSVVREIARAHGGDARVENRQNKGSRFELLLPLMRDETG